jgi:hypothetical protein
MTEMRTRFLFRLALEVGAHHIVGPTPVGDRRVAPISGGTFDGPQLSGTVLPGGTDWITVDAGGTCLRIDVRLPLRTLDGALLVMAYRGVRSGPSEVLERVGTRRGGRPGELLLPCGRLLRDGFAGAGLAQYGGRGRRWVEVPDRARLRGLRASLISNSARRCPPRPDRSTFRPQPGPPGRCKGRGLRSEHASSSRPYLPCSCSWSLPPLSPRRYLRASPVPHSS